MIEKYGHKVLAECAGNQKKNRREVDQMVTAIVNNSECGEFILKQLDSRVDVSDKHYDRKYHVLWIQGTYSLYCGSKEVSGADNV